MPILILALLSLGQSASVNDDSRAFSKALSATAYSPFSKRPLPRRKTFSERAMTRKRRVQKPVHPHAKLSRGKRERLREFPARVFSRPFPHCRLKTFGCRVLCVTLYVLFKSSPPPAGRPRVRCLQYRMSKTMRTFLVPIFLLAPLCSAFRLQRAISQSAVRENGALRDADDTVQRRSHCKSHCPRLPLLLRDASSEPVIFETGETAPPRLAYLGLWLGLLIYAFSLAPGGSDAAGLVDTEIIKTMISTPFDSSNPSSPVFTSIFNALGILPAVYASLLLPGSKLGQKIPALPFVMGSFALGFFGVGPYLGLRNKRESVLDSERGRGSILFEFKGTSLALLGFAMYLIYFAVTGAYAGVDRWSDYLNLFSSSRLAHVSTIDFSILSLAMIDPLAEDMKRRNWSGPKAEVFCAVPVLGPCIWLLLRPSLPTSR
jgi:hypothetical protein